MVRGRYVALELKRSSKEHAGELQLYMLKKIKRARGIALVVYPENWEQVYELLQKLSGGDYDKALLRSIKGSTVYGGLG